jgi:hypothetical protein
MFAAPSGVFSPLAHWQLILRTLTYAGFIGSFGSSKTTKIVNLVNILP